MKLNDWIITTLNNPDFSISELLNIGGLNIENTQLLDLEEYLKSPYILGHPAFLDAEGNFSEEKFKTFYNNLQSSFIEFASENDLLSRDYNIWDTRNLDDSKVASNGFKFILLPNPDRISLGVVGRNILGERTKSISEIALTLKIFDTKSDTFLDETPNDNVLFKHPGKYLKSLFDDPLVLAAYDEEGDHIDPITGLLIHHTKGLYKLNEDGTYYYETLNGRSIRNKEVLSSFDTLTVDGSWGNRNLDFLDSDDIKKSSGKVIAQTLASIAPIAIGGPVTSAIYSGLLITRELSKTLPMAYRMLTMFAGNEEEPELANTIAGIATKFTSGTSESSKQNMFSFENFGHLVSDVALLWGQQKLIALSIGKLASKIKDVEKTAKTAALSEYISQSEKAINDFKKGKISFDTLTKSVGAWDKNGLDALVKSGWENTLYGLTAIMKYLPLAEQQMLKFTKLGLDLSLGYMALVSNTDVYDDAINHGATKSLAAALALGSTLGMFSVDKFLHLGEIFFDDAKAAEKRLFRAGLVLEMQPLIEKTKPLTLEVIDDIKNPLYRIVKAASNKAKKFVGNYSTGLKEHSLGFLGKSFGEGIEEVSEELVTDIVKSLGELSHDFGWIDTNDLGAWDQTGPRYLMNFLGGAIGGAMFYGVDILNNPLSAADEKTKNQILYLVKEKKTKQLLDYLDKMHKKGELGSKTLSLKNDDVVSASDSNISLNDFIYNRLREEILLLDLILNENDLNLTDDLLFEKLLLNNKNFISLKNLLEDASYLSGYTDRFFDLIKDITDTQQELDNIEKSIPGDSKEAQSKRELATVLLKEKLSELITERDNFLNGLYSPYYLEKTLFLMDVGLSSAFLPMNFSLFVWEVYRLNVDNLTSSEREKYLEKWNKYKQSNPAKFDDAFAQFKAMLKNLAPMIEELDKVDTEKWGQTLERIINNWPTNDLIDYNTQLEDESPEEFEKRFILEGESEEDFKSRLLKRLDKINKLNELKVQDNFNLFLNNEILLDSNTARRLNLLIGKKLSDRLLTITDDLTTSEAAKVYSSDILNLIKDSILNIDLENPKNTSEQFRNNLKNRVLNDSDPIFTKLLNFAESIKADIFNDELSNITLFDSILILKNLGILIENEDGIIFNTEELSDITLNIDGEDRVFTKDLLTDLRDYFTKPEEEGNLGLTTAFDIIGNNGEYALLNISAFSVSLELLEFLNILNEITNILGIPNDLSIEDIYKALLLLGYITPSGDIINIVPQDSTITLEQSYTISSNAILNLNNYFADEKVSQVSYGFKLFLNLGIDKAKYTSGDNLIEFALGTTVDNIISPIVNEISMLIDKIHKDATLQALHQINKKVKSDYNPVLKVIELVGKIFDDFNIEKTLREINEKYLLAESTSKFILDDPLIDALKKAMLYLKLAGASTKAATSRLEGNLFIGHNKLMEVFLEDHPEIKYDLSPYFSSDIGKVLLYEYDLYTEEINKWIELSDKNNSNRTERLKRLEKAIRDTRILFLKNNKFIVNEIDLLDGFEEIPEDSSTKYLSQISNLLYVNTQKAISSKKLTWDLILLELIPSICGNNVTLFETSKLDESFKYETLTAYDKLLMLVSTMCYSMYDFNREFKNYLEANDRIVPIAALMYVEYLTAAQRHNKEVVNKALEIVSEINLREFGRTTPVIYNTTVNYGYAGVGKTDAVGIFNSFGTEEIWVAGPTETLKNKLSSRIKNKGSFTIDELISKIVSAESILLISDALDNRKPNDIASFQLKTGESTSYSLKKEGIKYNKIENIPNTIVIDEFKYSNSLLIQALSLWCLENNVELILMGDDSQISNLNLGIFNEQTSAVWITPRLTESIRILNNNKYYNQSLTESIHDLLRDYRIKGTGDFDSIVKDIQNIHFKYYNKETFSGELITEKIDDSIIAKLKGKVAYVGNTTTSTYRQLKNSDLDITVYDAPEKIQGEEYSYVIIDINWNYPFNKDNNLENKDIYSDTLKFARLLYTMLTRSTEGTIFIDNGLTDIIGKSEETDINILLEPVKNITKEFRDYILLDIESVEQPIIEESTEEPSEKKTQPAEKIPTDEESEGYEEAEEEVGEEALDDGSSKLLADSEAELKLEENPINKIGQRKEREDIEQGRFRFYMNIQAAGIAKDDLGHWIAERNNKDLGIVIREGDDLNDKSVIKLRVRDLFDIKRLLIFKDSRTSVLSTSSPVTREALKNAKYYIHVYDSEHLIGLSTVKSSTITPIKHTSIDGLLKVITLVAKFNNIKGEEVTLTLGAVADPKTWDSKKRKTEKEQLEINSYKIAIDALLEQGQSGEFFLEIDEPEFSKNIEFGKLDNKIRLENLYNYESTFDDFSQYFRISPIYVKVLGLKGTDTEEEAARYKKFNGHGLVYITLDPDVSLDTIDFDYSLLDDNDHSIRPLFLDNAGVAFSSLYNNSFLSLYEFLKDGKNTFYPIHIRETGVRMYRAMWNYRAELEEFFKVLDELRENDEFKDLSNLELSDLVQREAQYYLEDLAELKKKYISFNEFLETERAKKRSDLSKLERLWKLNESINGYENTVREGLDSKSTLGMIRFRIGSDYKITEGDSVSTRNGAVIRNVGNNRIATFIDPIVAEEHQQILNWIFNNVLNNIITPNNTIKTSLKITKLGDKWFEKTSKGEVMFKMSDESNEIDFKVDSELLLGVIPITLCNIMENLYKYGRNQSVFLHSYEEGRHRIEVNGIELKYLDIANIINGNKFYNSKLNASEIDDLLSMLPSDLNYGIKLSYEGETLLMFDNRLDNFFNLMFHGLISTTRYNDFTYKEDIRDDLAEYKFGIFSDPILGKYRDDALNLSLTSRKLFLINRIPLLPIGTFSLEKKTTIADELPVFDEVQTSKLDVVEQELLNSEEEINLLRSSGMIGLKRRVTSIGNAVVTYYNNCIDGTPLSNQYIVNNDNKLVLLRDLLNIPNEVEVSISKLSVEPGSDVELSLDYLDTTITISINSEGKIGMQKITNNSLNEFASIPKEIKNSLITTLENISSYASEEDLSWEFKDSLLAFENSVKISDNYIAINGSINDNKLIINLGKTLRLLKRAKGEDYIVVKNLQNLKAQLDLIINLAAKCMIQ